MRPDGRFLALLVAALSQVSSTANASTQDLFGFGPRAIATGATGTAYCNDWSCVHTNPAGLSRARRTAFALGFVGGVYSFSTQRGSEPAQAAAIDRIRATTIGVTLPLPFGGVLEDRFTLGLGFYTPTDVVVRGRLLRPEEPQFLVLADRTQSVAIQGGLGVRLPGGVRIGGGVAALAAIVGSVLIAPDASGRIGSRVDNQLVTSYAPMVGASFERDWLHLGAVFRGTLSGSLAVTIEARDIGLPLPVFNIAGIAQWDPWQIALEGAYVRNGWTASVQVTFKRWSDYPGPLVPTTPTTMLRPPAPNFSDIVVARLGVERRWQILNSAITVRGGAFFEPTPTPDATSAANYLDNHRLAGTAGIALSTVVRGSELSLDVFGQFHGLLPRTQTKDPAVAATNPGAPTLSHGGTLVVLGLNAGVTF